TPQPNGAQNGNGKSKEKKPRKSNTPFQRVKPDEVKFADERLKDNRFEARGASASDYGARAARDLVVTRGAGFRKEKNKKKRGSYRGGEITMQSYSIKFND
ncbi:SRP40, C-terminal domain-containing protein, partial [Trametes punicea]